MQHILSFPNKKFDADSKIPLYISNSGYYKNVAHPISVIRPCGRLDYQLILPINGSILIDRKKVTPGSIIIYCPLSPQNYTYWAGDGSEYYWIHFSGCDVDKICKDLSLSNGIIMLGDGRQDTERLVRMIIKAFSDRYKYADEYASGLLRAILAIIASPPVFSSPFTKAIKLLSDPSCNLSVSELAKMYDMSEGHFIRSFKCYAGTSPGIFKTTKRIEIACEMLASTKITIEQVARAAGYTDPLYFSRVFKNHLGTSPKEYRALNTMKTI